ncbi:hypothetical protein [Clostridium cadaveris]|uniref:hypothetical protein n=1 Tax=Clostridium cadaveris TaxID=1529 RepID=UPI00399633E4
MSYEKAEMILVIIAAVVLFIGICEINSPRTTATDFIYQYSRTASHQDIKSRWGQDFDLIRSGYGFFIRFFIVGITMVIYCFAIEKIFL